MMPGSSLQLSICYSTTTTVFLKVGVALRLWWEANSRTAMCIIKRMLSLRALSI